MDIVQHAMQGALVLKIADTVIPGEESSLPVYIGAAIVGAAPDIAGVVEKLVKRNWRVWSWYSAAHSAGALFFMGVFFFGSMLFAMDSGAWWIPAYLLAYILHIGLDAFTHIDLGAKRNWYPPSEWWREKFWTAIAYCWPNWLGWACTITLFIKV